MSETLKKEKILIYGGTGSLGKTLIKRLGEDNEILCFSRDEAKHWTMRNEFPHISGKGYISYAVGDVRDYSRVSEVLLRFQPTTVIIAAALKHVDTCELSPDESIKTNLAGVQNIVDAIEKNISQLWRLQTCVMVSTDKACAPINVYGMCKSLAERVVLAKSKLDHLNHVKFVATRYGNVLESRGSIIPLFMHQAEHAEAFTLTHRQMTRFLMTLDESVDLIEYACTSAQSGETVIPILRSMRVFDLAQIFSERFQKPIKVIGIRPGEKIHEDLVNQTESLRTYKKDDHYIIRPSWTGIITPDVFAYSSQTNILNARQLEQYLMGLGMFDNIEFVGKSIDEIRKVSIDQTDKMDNS